MTSDRVLILEHVSRGHVRRTASGRNLLQASSNGYPRTAPRELHAAHLDEQVELTTDLRYVLTTAGRDDLAAHYAPTTRSVQ